MYAVTALQAYSRLVVADQAALPDQNFYVDAVNMQDIGKQLLGKRTLMFLGVRQSGKSTDAMALGRKLGMFGYEVRLPLEIHLCISSMHTKSLSLALFFAILRGTGCCQMTIFCILQVAYVCIGPKAANKGFNTEMVWAEVLQRLGIERQQGLASLSILCSLPESKKKGIVLIFDEVTAPTGHAGALDIFVQEIRSLQYSTRYWALLAWLWQTVTSLMRGLMKLGRVECSSEMLHGLSRAFFLFAHC